MFEINMQLHAAAPACPWGVGSKTKTLIAFETAYGTTPGDAATKSIKLPINSNNVVSSQNSTTPQTITGSRSPVEPILGNNDVSGDIVVPVDYTAFPYWLKALFGDPSTTKEQPKAGYNTHTFKIGDTQPSFTLEKAFPGINTFARENGCKVSKLSLSVGGDGELTATISVMGAKESIETSTMGTTPIEAVFTRTQNFQAKVKIGGTAKGKITSFSMDIDMGLDGDTYCIGGGGYREAICEGLVTISGSLEAFFDNGDYLTMAENSTETSAEVIFTQGDLSLSFKLPEIKFARTSPGIDGPGGVKQNLTYNAYYQDGSEKSAVVVTVVNKVTAY